MHRYATKLYSGFIDSNIVLFTYKFICMWKNIDPQNIFNKYLKKTLIYVSTFPVIHFSIWIYNKCICYFYRLAIFIAGITTGMAFRHTLNKLACTKLPKSTPTRCLSTSLYLSKRFNLFSKVKIMSINWDLANFYSWKMYRSFS